MKYKFNELNNVSKFQYVFGILCVVLSSLALLSGAIEPAIILGACAYININMGKNNGS